MDAARSYWKNHLIVTKYYWMPQHEERFRDVVNWEKKQRSEEKMKIFGKT